MSISADNRKKIESYLLEKIAQGEAGAVRKTADNFALTETTVHKYINTLISRGVIKRSGRGAYVLVSEHFSVTLSRERGELRSEDVIYDRYVEPHLGVLPENVSRIWRYIVSEMINNVIDHSEAENLTIRVDRNVFDTVVILSDNGIGIFNRIKTALDLETLQSAAAELFKGKVTTDKAKHSGEGIFFSSRMADEFAAVSDGLIFTRNSFDDDRKSEILKSAEDVFDTNNGTTFFIRLSNNSKKTAKEIFDQFTDEDLDFSKTVIPVKNYFNGLPISRSQAKRLCAGLERFKTVELDMEGIDMIGQGFADEMFRVFANGHQELALVPTNMSEDVYRMYRHVTAAAR